jgi:hypothetical protein
MQLANFNVARMAGPIDGPVMAGFVDNLDRINTLADESPGFVWRLQDASGDATSYRPFPADDEIIVNLTVWESVDALRAFVFKTEHVDFLRRRREWFTPYEGAYLALWWVPDGHIPSVEEAMERLAHIGEHGPSEYAFTFAKLGNPVT